MECTFWVKESQRRKIKKLIYTDSATGGHNKEFFIFKAGKMIKKRHRRYVVVCVRMEKYRNYSTAYGIKAADNLIEDLTNKEKKYKEDLKQKENENLLIINQFNELKEEFENENNKEKEALISNNKKNLFFKNLSIDENISVYLISSNNKTDEKTNILNEERNILITKSRKSETNSSTNHFNKINLNSNINTYSNNLNENILNNYLNTINVGYNGVNENYKINIDNEENLIVNDNAVECEPTPSFIVCIKKMNNI